MKTYQGNPNDINKQIQMILLCKIKLTENKLKQMKIQYEMYKGKQISDEI